MQQQRVYCCTLLELCDLTDGKSNDIILHVDEINQLIQTICLVVDYIFMFSFEHTYCIDMYAFSLFFLVYIDIVFLKLLINLPIFQFRLLIG